MEWVLHCNSNYIKLNYDFETIMPLILSSNNFPSFVEAPFQSLLSSCIVFPCSI